MKEQNYLNLIGKYLSGNISPAEEAQLMEWVSSADANRSFFEEMTQLWSFSDEYAPPTIEVDTQKSWISLDARLDAAEANNPAPDSSEPAEAKVRRLSFSGYSVLKYAAAVLLLFVAGYWSYQYVGTSAPATEMVSISTTDGEERSLMLPDSSLVVLNENSSLTYPADFTDREVQLSGEAFFDVTKQAGKTFTILAEGTTTTVLGTSFNVRAYPVELKVEVSVSTGKVAVTKEGEKEEKVELIAGQASVYNKVEDKLAKTTVQNAIAWKTNRLDFDNINLGTVAENMERYFDITIEFEDERLKACHYMGSFPDPGLEDIFSAMEFTMDLKVVAQGEGYLIKGDASQCQ